MNLNHEIGKNTKSYAIIQKNSIRLITTQLYRCVALIEKWILSRTL